MKRIFAMIAGVVVGLAGASLLLAQIMSNPFIGTWKLNLEKSKYTGVEAPKSATRTIEADNDGEIVTFVGVAADGTPIRYSFTTNLDGKPVSVSGFGAHGGIDTQVVTRVDAYTLKGTATKAGKVVYTQRTVVSKDGKVTTETREGKDENGQPISVVAVWEKQ
jgi:hypothetical protein